ncbi:MAG: hypothetical protein LBG87_09260 [Spirochaetaceae bacterium]|jgi:hypothetical protein|nr:hypothetical protein [Spirochaetaceae bacterium]
MKKRIFAVMLFGLLAAGFVCETIGAAESETVYRLAVIDRARCPGAAAHIDNPLYLMSHGSTGYYIIFGKGGLSVPTGGVVLVNVSSKRLAVIREYLSDPDFRQYVSSPKVLESLRFAVQAAGK